MRHSPSGALRSIAPSVVGPVIARLTHEHPDLSVEVTLDDGEGPLVSEGFDAAVRFLDQTAEDMVADLEDVPQQTRNEFAHFFERYKDLEPGKFVNIDGWGDAAEEERIVQDGFTRLQDAGADHA